MGWLIVVLGSALSAVGAMAITFGWEIVRDERGWTQVISGSVGLSGGIMTIALGLVLMRLGGLRRDMQRLFRDVQATPPAAKPPAEALLPAEPRPPPERKRRKDIPSKPREPPPETLSEPAAPATASFAPALASGGALAAAASPAEEATPPERAAVASQETVAPITDVPHPADRGPEPAHRSLSEPIVPPEDPSLVLPPAMPNIPETTPGKPDEPGWLPPLRDTGFSYDRFEAELARLDQVENAATRTHEPEPIFADEPPPPEPQSAVAKSAPMPAAEVPQAAKSAIVGQYEAGGVAYIMYADGSIEADTPNGVYRFVDINELKAFIQSQGSQG